MAATTGIGTDEQKRVQDYVKREFNALVRDPGQTLFHYTTGPAAACVLDEARFQATNLLYLDDGKEIQHAVDCLRAALEGRHSRIPRPTIDLDTLVTSFLARLNRTVPPDVWVVTFTEQRDSTLHWQTYQGASHGVALGFVPDRMAEAAAENGALLVPCCYDDGAKIGIMARALDLLEQLLNARTARTPESDQALIRHILREVALFGALMKREDQADENEWRLVLCNASQTPAGAGRIRAMAQPDYTGLSIDIPLEGGDGRLPLSEIVIGPSPQRHLTERAFRTLLYKNGYENVAVSAED